MINGGGRLIRRWLETMFSGLDNISGQATLENFILAFAKLGYEPCENSELENGFEKVAIYVSTKDEIHAPKGTPTHMARQLKNGNWTSKLGKDVDISHKTLQSIEGKTYGIVRANSEVRIAEVIKF